MYLHKKHWFLSLLIMTSCNNNNPSESSQLFENAISDDPDTRAVYIRDEGSAPEFVLITNAQGLNKYQGYKVQCANFRETRKLLNAFGIDGSEISFIIDNKIKSDSIELQGTNWKTNPILGCHYGEEADLFKINYGTEENAKWKYFINFMDEELKEKLFNIGCEEVVNAMGFKIDEAEEIAKSTADRFLTKGNVYDLNCVTGTPFKTQEPAEPPKEDPEPPTIPIENKQLTWSLSSLSQSRDYDLNALMLFHSFKLEVQNIVDGTFSFRVSNTCDDWLTVEEYPRYGRVTFNGNVPFVNSKRRCTVRISGRSQTSPMGLEELVFRFTIDPVVLPTDFPDLTDLPPGATPPQPGTLEPIGFPPGATPSQPGTPDPAEFPPGATPPQPGTLEPIIILPVDL